MKTNFKKLAVQAGVAAAMAAGSMAASAQIESVPATAQLVPLFYYNDNGIDTDVRIVVPKSVGADTVIDLMDGGLNAGTKWAVANPALVSGAAIHWFWMSAQSTEMLDGTVAVSPDDEEWLSAAQIDHRIGTGSLSGTPGYLIIVNDSAAFGGAPTFQFAADAYIDNDQFAYPSLPSQLSLPVLGMNDAADSAISIPTPGNQVIEAPALVSGGPDASPLFSGIRTSATLPGANFRVVDVPMFTAGGRFGSHHNVIVVWSDRNLADSLNIPTLYAVDHHEQAVSFPGFELENELNFVVVPASTDSWNLIGGLEGAMGIDDSYSNIVSSASSRTLTDGFLKLVMPAEALPVGAGLEPGAYSSVVIFNVPVAADVLNPSTDAPINAIDTGFFTSAQ